MSLGENIIPYASHDLYKQQAIHLLNGLGFQIAEPDHKNDPLRFLVAAQGKEEKYTRFLAEDENRYAKAIVPYKNENRTKRSRTPNSLANELVNQLRHDKNNVASYFIHGSAGTGKSVYLATLFSSIRESLLSDVENINLHLPVVNANIKISKSIWEPDFSLKTVLDGILVDDLFPTQNINSIEALANALDIGKSHYQKGLILIDSLDEYLSTHSRINLKKVREEIIDVNHEFQSHGFVPIWACRTQEFEKLELEKVYTAGHEKLSGVVRRYSIPYLETNDLADICFALSSQSISDSSEILKHVSKINDVDSLPDAMDDQTKQFLRWVGRATSMNPLFFYFRIFAPPSLAPKLTHNLVENMYQAYLETKTGDEISAGNFTEVQNTNTISDLVLKTLFQHLNNHYGELIDGYSEAVQHFIGKFQQAIPLNPEDLSVIHDRLYDEKNPHVGEILKESFFLFGLVHQLKARSGAKRRIMFRHRAFAEYLGVCSLEGDRAEPSKCVDLIEKKSKNSIWGWRLYDEARLHQLKTPIFQRTGGFSLAHPNRFHKNLDNYVNKMKEAFSNLSDENFEFSDGIEAHEEPRKNGTAFSEEQVRALKAGLTSLQPIILRGWPGTGKTYTGTHFLLSRLVNNFIKSGYETYLPENQSKGLIVTLNPELSKFLRSDHELNVYQNGPWRQLLENKGRSGVVDWSDLRQCIEILSAQEIIEGLDGGEGSLTVVLLDTKDVFEKFWRGRFLSLRINDPDHTPTSYSWPQGSRDLEELFFDEFGNFAEDPEFPADAFDNDRRLWHEIIRLHLVKQNYITIQSASLKLIHRFVQSFDYHGEFTGLPSTKLSPHDQRTEEELISEFQRNPIVERYSVSLVDEVQDLPVAACILISMIVSRNQNRDNVMLAGDENQVLNQSKFKWKTFFGQHNYIIQKIRNFYNPGKLSSKSYLHMEDIKPKSQGDDESNNFVLNYRNLEPIVKTWVKAGSWNPTNLEIKDIPNIDKCVSMVKAPDLEPNAVKFVFLNLSEGMHRKTGKDSTESKRKLQQTPMGQQRNAVRQVVNLLGGRSGISLISMSEIITKFREQPDVSDWFAKTELYTPNTIKGLERDAVVLLGTAAYSHDSDLSDVGFIESERMKLIVGLSRGRFNVVVFIPHRQGEELILGNSQALKGEHHDIEHFIHDASMQVRTIETIEGIEDAFAELLPAKDREKAFEALSELMQANAYKSDQLQATQARVESILIEDLKSLKDRDVSTSLFRKYVQDVLKFVQDKKTTLPFEVLILLHMYEVDPKDGIKKVSLKDRIKKFPEPSVAHGPLGGLLSSYIEDFLAYDTEKNHIAVLLNRHKVYSGYKDHLSRLGQDSNHRRYKKVEVSIRRFEEGLAEELNTLLSIMKFGNYPWSDDLRDDDKLALMMYLSIDFELVEKQMAEFISVKETKKGKLNLNDLYELVYSVSNIKDTTLRMFNKLSGSDSWKRAGVDASSFAIALDSVLVAMFRVRETLETEQLLLDALKPSNKNKKFHQIKVIDQDLLIIKDSFDHMLYDFPVAGIKHLRQSSLLILIREMLTLSGLGNDRSLQTAVHRLLVVYFSRERWQYGELAKDHQLADRMEPLKISTFTRIYEFLPPEYINAMVFDHLPFAFRQHDLRKKWENKQDSKLLIQYCDLFKEITHRYLSHANIFNKRDWKWIHDRLDGEVKGSLEHIQDFFEFLLDRLEEFDDQTSALNAAVQLCEILLKYHSESYIKPMNGPNGSVVDGHFLNTIKSLSKSGILDLSVVVHNLLDEVEDCIKSATERSVEKLNRVLYNWASLRLLEEHKLHTFSEHERSIMKDLNRKYPILNLKSTDRERLMLEDFIPSSDYARQLNPTFSEGCWKVLTDKAYTGKKWFAGGASVLDYSVAPENHPILVISKEDIPHGVDEFYLPRIGFVDYHKLLNTYDHQGHDARNRFTKLCEENGIIPIFSSEMYHGKICRYVKKIFTRIHQFTSGAQPTTNIGIDTLAARIREYAEYKDTVDEHGKLQRRVPWPFDIVSAIQNAKSSSTIKDLYVKEANRLEELSPLAIGGEDEQKLKAERQSEIWNNIHENLLDYVVKDQWTKQLKKQLVTYFNYNVADDVLSYSRNAYPIEELRDWVVRR